jgi:hypothetical protein
MPSYETAKLTIAVLIRYTHQTLWTGYQSPMQEKMIAYAVEMNPL